MTQFAPSEVHTFREAVYLDSINEIILGIEQYSAVTCLWSDFDLSNAVSFSVELIPAAGNSNDPQGPFSTTTYAGIVSAPTEGELRFKLGELAILEGDYFVRLTAVDVSGDATVILHEEHPFYRLLVTVVEAA